MTQANLQGLKEWQIQQGKLYKKFEFESFVAAMLFMQQVSEYCENVNHHPVWQNCYRQIEVWLWTHDENAVTEKDIALARKMDELSHNS